ncbi:unnamed protein product [Haemonchus placei]|uniref:Cystatin domain-containing protein n=1 Tax=Haemonchus placei TaxID=6290 RepID=A0A0N4VU06_HAEPC|nr:unnamed protein product [Haemonchus placei]
MWDGSGKVIKQCIQPGTNSKEFHVGNPNENARMKISNLKDGYSYKLSIKDDVCLLQKTSKASAFKFFTVGDSLIVQEHILWKHSICQQIAGEVSG